MPDYLRILKDNGVKDVVRICDDGVYDKTLMESEGVKVWDSMKFEDGSVPSNEGEIAGEAKQSELPLIFCFNAFMLTY